MLFESASYQSFLKTVYLDRLEINPRYSQRAFSRDLGISPGELSEVFRDKRHLSPRSLIAVIRSLSLNTAEAKHFLYLASTAKARAVDGTHVLPAQETLSPSTFNVVSQWYCFAILNLIECSNFHESPLWIARRLGISATEAADALARLKRAGLVVYRGKRLLPIKDYVLSPEGQPSTSVRRFHHQMLQKARQALECQPLNQREISGVTMAMDPRDVASIKKELSEFLDTIVSRYGRKRNRSEVYHLETAFFRLTKEKSHDH